MTHLPQPARGRSLASHRAVRRATTQTAPVERPVPRGKRVPRVAAAESSSAEVEMRAADANS